MNDKLLKACENGDLNTVKELVQLPGNPRVAQLPGAVQSNKYDSKIISGAKAIALFNAHFDILTYLNSIKN